MYWRLFIWDGLAQLGEILPFSHLSSSPRARETPDACNFIKKETLAQVFSSEFCQISKNTYFKEHLWATASTLREGRRLMQTEISIFSKLHKENDKKIKMFLHFRFFTCCAHPFPFRASLFIKRHYVSLYSYFHYVQTCWICKTYLNTCVKN